MFLTIEELYSFKEKYEAEISELQRKKLVVDELIAYAEAKEEVTTEEVEPEVSDTVAEY